MRDCVSQTFTELDAWRRRFDAVADLALTVGDGEEELRRFMGKTIGFAMLEDIALEGELTRYHQKKESLQ